MRAQTKPFAVCIDNTNYQASLVPGKVYRVVPDAFPTGGEEEGSTKACTRPPKNRAAGDARAVRQQRCGRRSHTERRQHE
jgi:hypothetical protein